MGDLVVKVFESRALPASKSPYCVDIRLVGDFGRQQRTHPIKGNENPIWNQGFQFKVRKQDIKVRFEILKLGTFSDTSMGVVEVAVGHLLAGVPSDMWLQFLKTAFQLHIELTFIPDFQLQRDIAIQKALDRTPSNNVGHLISSGGTTILSDINRSIDGPQARPQQPGAVYVTTTSTMQPAPVGAPAPGGVVYTQQHPQQQPGPYSVVYTQQQPQPQPQQLGAYPAAVAPSPVYTQSHSQAQLNPQWQQQQQMQMQQQQYQQQQQMQQAPPAYYPGGGNPGAYPPQQPQQQQPQYQAQPQYQTPPPPYQIPQDLQHQGSN